MDIEELRREVDPTTFQPFEIVLVNGATFPVPYHDSLFVPRNRRSARQPRFVNLYHEEDGTSRTIDAAMIAQIVHRETGLNGHTTGG